MKKIMLLSLVLALALGTAAFANEDSTSRGLRQGLTLEGEALEDFHADMLNQKQEWIDQLVAEGSLTAEEGVAFMTRMAEGFENCDGTPGQYGKELSIPNGKGFGAMNGNRQGNGLGNGQGRHGRWQTTE